MANFPSDNLERSGNRFQHRTVEDTGLRSGFETVQAMTPKRHHGGRRSGRHHHGHRPERRSEAPAGDQLTHDEAVGAPGRHNTTRAWLA